jgi:uncharacterized protein (DUF2267 family)
MVPQAARDRAISLAQELGRSVGGEAFPAGAREVHASFGMNRVELVGAVCLQAGMMDDAWAEAALRRTLTAIASGLDADARGWLATRLPQGLDAAVSRAPADASADRASIARRVAHAEGVPYARALEQVQLVMRALGSLLSDDERRALRERLPADAGDLLPDPVTHTAPRVEHLLERPRGQHHLSDGRPGSAHPLSDSRAPDAQSDSVATSSDPHAGTRLSSARPPVRDAEKPR